MFLTNLILALSLFQNPPEFRPGQVFSESPNDQAYAAAKFLQSALEAESKIVSAGSTLQYHAANLRFISLYNVPAHGTRLSLLAKNKQVEEFSPLDDMVKVLVFAINQTNRINPPVTLIRVKPDLFAVYFDSPGWSAKAWEDMATKNSYFFVDSVCESTWNYLTYYTGSQYPIMRADQFISLSTIAPDYYALLNLPKTVKEFYDLLGINEKLLADTYRIKGSVKTDNLTVTINNRILERRQGAFDVWTSNDVINSKGKKNALRQLDVIGGDIHKLDIDGNEHVFELGWGGWGGFLNDAKGNRVDEVPIAIARDDNYRDYRVIAGRSCITCHDQGIKPFSSDQITLLANQVIQLRTIKPDDAIALAGRYDEKAIQRNIRTDQENYRAAVEDLTGVSPEKISAMYANVWRNYNEQRITFAQASIECGLSNDAFIATLVPSIDPNLLKFLELDENKKTRTLARDVWEDSFKAVMLLKGRPTLKKDQESLPVPSGDQVKKPIANDDAIDIIGKISLVAPATVGERQNGEISLQSKTPFVVVSYNDAKESIFLNTKASDKPVTEQKLSFLFIAGQSGFPSEVSIKTDKDKWIKIPIEIRPR